MARKAQQILSRDPNVVGAIKRQAVKAKLHAANDAITNMVTGIGTSRDKTRGNFYFDAPPLDVYTLEALFANNDLAYTIVTKPVDDALRAWFGVEQHEPSKDEDERARAIMGKLEELGAKDLMKDGATWGRLFGGGGVVLVVDGAGDPSMPLDDDKVTDVVSLVAFDRQDMQAVRWYKNGQPQVYLWTRPPTYGGPVPAPQLVHESRLLLFGGARTTNRRKAINYGWDLSILQRVYEVLKAYDAMWASVDNMFADASQAVFKMQGLIQSLAEADGEGTQDVQTRLAFMDMVRSSAKAIMLDAGNKAQGEEAESFEVVERSTLGTLDGVIQAYMIRLATAARMPLTVLLGMAPAGMDATGESDMVLYFNTIDIYRADDLEPNFLRLVRLCARAVGDAEPESWCIRWPELARPKPVDVATAEKMNVDAAVSLITSQALLPEEVALNLSRIAPSMNLRIDLEPRKTALEDGLAEVENREIGVGRLEAEAEIKTESAVQVAESKPVAPAPAQPAGKTSGRKTKAKAAGSQT